MPEELAAGYPTPVARLLTLGEPGFESEPELEADAPGGWPTYAALGLGQEHVPDLVRLLDDALRLDETEDLPDSLYFAALHARRALGQLRAEAAVDVLIETLRRDEALGMLDEWVIEEVPRALGMIGPAALPKLLAALADDQNGNWTRLLISESITDIAIEHPETRAEVVAALMATLEGFETQDGELNASLAHDLTRLGAVEAAGLIERAYAAERIDLLVMGDWEDAQILLGLREKRTKPRRRFFSTGSSRLDRELTDELDASLPVPDHIREWNAAVDAKRLAKEQARALKPKKKKKKKR